MGFNAKKALKGVGKDLDTQGAVVSARASQALSERSPVNMDDIRKDMAAKTAARVASKAAPQKQSFAEAFRAARKDKGAGSTFTWRGKSYSTNMAGEGKAPSRPATSSVAKSDKAAPAPRPAAKQEDKPITVTASRDQAAKAKQQAPAQATQPKRTPSADGPGSLFLDKPEYRAARARAPYTTPSAPAASAKPGVDPRAAALARASAARAAERATAARAAAARAAAARAAAEPKPDVWAPGAKPSGGRLLLKDNDYKKGGAAKQPVKKFAKGGSVDGCAVRGKTRAPLRKK